MCVCTSLKNVGQTGELVTSGPASATPPQTDLCVSTAGLSLICITSTHFLQNVVDTDKEKSTFGLF